MDQTNAVDDCEQPTAADQLRRRNRRRVLVALAVASISLTGASAATLGGVGARSIGADRVVVVSCDTNGVTVVRGPMTYNAALHAYTMTTFSVRQIAAACIGRTLSLTLRDSSNAALGSLSAVVAGARVNLTLATPVRVSQIAGIAVAIT